MKRGRWAHTAIVTAVALGVRVALVAWAFAKFPPLADGKFYQTFATRLAEGLGYTVAWDDGAVTYAAHYPVGYPAILALAYRVVGSEAPGVAMVVNGAIGTLAAACAHRLALREVSPRVALACGLALALHPSIVLYTPALMTEGVAAALVVVALACAPPKNATRNMYIARIIAMGAIFGVATLVRPQTIAFVPFLAFFFLRRVVPSAAVLACALLTVAPWTARNCARMHRCALVSVNGGWNLLIGVHTENGSWAQLESPEECKTVWDEAAKDLCFEHAARAEIDRAPRAWLAKMPRKLAVTFDVFAAGPWYLFHSNPRAFGDRAVIVWGAIDALAARVFLVLALVTSAPLWRLRVRQKRLKTTVPRLVLAVVGVAFAFSRHAWPAYAILAACSLVRGRGERRSALRASSGLIVAATMATHAAFFGAGRYGLLVVPILTIAAFACVRPKALSASALSASGR